MIRKSARKIPVKAQAARPAPPASNVRKVDGPQKKFSDNMSLLPDVRSGGSISIGPDGMPQFSGAVSQAKPGVSQIKAPSGPMEQVEIDKANKLAATPKTYMPQANTVPNAAMAAQQKMPPPNMVPPANAMPMAPTPGGAPAMKRGGSVRNKPAAKFSSGGSTSKASSRGDGIAQRGKTKGRYI